MSIRRYKIENSADLNYTFRNHQQIGDDDLKTWRLPTVLQEKITRVGSRVVQASGVKEE